jgi:hypothetical protein
VQTTPVTPGRLADRDRHSRSPGLRRVTCILGVTLRRFP